MQFEESSHFMRENHVIFTLSDLNLPLCTFVLVHGMYSVISCYFIDFIPAKQIILFVRGSKNRVKSVRVYEVAPRFCARLFIMDKNRYPADEDHFFKK